MKEVAKKRKRGFAVGETDEVRKDDIRKKEEKREAKEMENRIKKVIWGSETNKRFKWQPSSLTLSLSHTHTLSLSLAHTLFVFVTLSLSHNVAYRS